jgi:phosphate acyltransferase
MHPAARIAVDAMGGDFGPSVNIRGALLALEADPEIHLILVGDKALITQELTLLRTSESLRLKVVPSTESVTMEDHAVSAARRKKDSSIHVGLRLIKEQSADAFLSAGNSGAVMATALLELGRVPGVERPAIVVRIPSAEKSTILLDAGANVDCRPSHLVQFAKMGNTYSKAWDGIERPRIALLANGAESHKGNELTRQAHAALSEIPELNYVGYVEGFDLFRGRAEVVVCDGFVGNVVLKVSEGLADTSLVWFRNEAEKSGFARIGLRLLKKILQSFRAKFDYQPYGAAPLLGINGLVFVSHGSSTAEAICSGILSARRGLKEAFLSKMQEIGKTQESGK